MFDWLGVYIILRVFKNCTHCIPLGGLFTFDKKKCIVTSQKRSTKQKRGKHLLLTNNSIIRVCQYAKSVQNM